MRQIKMPQLSPIGLQGPKEVQKRRNAVTVRILTPCTSLRFAAADPIHVAREAEIGPGIPMSQSVTIPGG